MIRQLLNKLCALVVALVAANSIYAQEDTTMVLSPGDFVLDPNAYYTAGVDKDKIGNDGVDEHYEGCDDCYGDSDHWELGEQFGWKYDSVIIFHDCETWESTNSEAGHAVKQADSQPEGWPTSWNFIQMGKSKNWGIDSLEFQDPHIMSPAFANLKSIEILVASDISINPGRDVFMIIEASRDGEVWGYVDEPVDDQLLYNAYLIQKLDAQGGNIYNYTSDNVDFANIVALSEDADSIFVRVMAFPDLDRNKTNGERLKIWGMTIEAQTIVDEVDPPDTVMSIGTLQNKANFIIRDGHFMSTNHEEIKVYNLAGHLLGSGKQVGIRGKGLYIVKSRTFTQKIFIN